MTTKENQKYKAVLKDELVATLGSQCSPHSDYEAYVIGPDLKGRICHIGSYRSYAEARWAAAAMNQNP